MNYLLKKDKTGQTVLFLIYILKSGLTLCYCGQIVFPGTENHSWDGHLMMCGEIPLGWEYAGVSQGLVTVLYSPRLFRVLMTVGLSLGIRTPFKVLTVC